MKIRVANESDLSELRDLAVRTFESAYAAFNTEEDMQDYLSSAFSDMQLRAELNDPGIMLLIGTVDDKIMAYAKLVRNPDKSQYALQPLEISRLYTDTSQIGNGLGRAMISAIIETARQYDHDAICLDVWQKNFRAINFYQREGFRICGITQFRLGRDIQDDFVMLRRV